MIGIMLVNMAFSIWLWPTHATDESYLFISLTELGYGCATILWHFKHQPEEFSTAPIDAKEELKIFEKVDLLRKASMGSPTQRPGSVGNIDMQKSRSVSQCTFSLLNRPIQHAPWTCVGTIADFLVAALASLKRPVMSPQMAMSWGYFDAEDNCWDFSA